MALPAALVRVFLVATSRLSVSICCPARDLPDDGGSVENEKAAGGHLP
jgi:hypothetical protein